MKKLKIRKKLTPDIFVNNDDSFIDEDPANFFAVTEESEDNKLPMDGFGNFKPRNFIGPPPIAKTQVITRTSEVKKTLIKGLGMKMQLDRPLDYNKKFKEALKTIEKNKKLAEIQEQSKTNLLSPREKIIANRQKRILDNFKKKNRYWGVLQKNLSEKTMKPADKLLSTIGLDGVRPDAVNKDKASDYIHKNFYWYLNLRNTVPDKSSTYIPVGNCLSGLFTLVKGKSQEWESFSPKAADLDELQVIGLDKLALEIEAVKSKGLESLNLDLIDRDGAQDAVIAEQYDRKVLAGKI